MERRALRNRVLVILIIVVLLICTVLSLKAHAGEGVQKLLESIPQATEFDATQEALGHVKGTDTPTADIVRDWRKEKLPEMKSIPGDSHEGE